MRTMLWILGLLVVASLVWHYTATLHPIQATAH